MKHLMGLAVGLALVGATGCATSIQTRPLVAGEPAPQGYPYRLKFTQYEIALKYRAVGCSSEPPADGSPPKPLKIMVEPTIAAKTAFDPDRFYIVDVRALGGPFKTSEANLEWYADRTLKSINTAVDDQTGQVITNVVTGVGKLASVAFSAGAPAGDVCDQGVGLAIKKVDAQKEVVDELEAKVAVATVRLARATAKSAQMGPAVDSATKAELSTAIEDLRAASELLSVENKQLADLMKATTFEAKFAWPEKADDRDSDFKTLPDKVVKDWGIAPDTAVVTKVRFELRSLETMAQPRSTVPQIESRPPQYKWPAAAKATVRETAWRGLPYREPAWASLRVCGPEACNSDGSDAKKKLDGLVLQMGPMLLLPFEGQAFSSAKASAAFTEGGVLQTAGFARTRSTGLGLSETFKGAAEQIAPILQAERDRDLKTLEDETARLKAEKAYQDAKAALDPVAGAEALKEIKTLETQTNLLKAQKALFDAQVALSPATVPDADKLATIKSLETEVSFLKAQASVLASQKALALAKAEQAGNS